MYFLPTGEKLVKGEYQNHPYPKFIQQTML